MIELFSITTFLALVAIIPIFSIGLIVVVVWKILSGVIKAPYREERIRKSYPKMTWEEYEAEQDSAKRRRDRSR